jgi:hypothetical protein
VLSGQDLQANAIRLGDGSAGSWNATIKRVTILCDHDLDIERESRRDVVFFDDFDRADSQSLGVSPTGQSIARTGSVMTSVLSSKWVAENGGVGLDFAAYGKVDIAHPPRYMGAVLNWTTGRSGGAAGFISATNNLTHPADALHCIVTDRDQIFQTMTASSVDPALATCKYAEPMARDGATQYGVACLINARENAVVFIAPNGAMPRHADKTYTQRAGNTAVFEHYWQIGQCRPEFSAVATA